MRATTSEPPAAGADAAADAGAADGAVCAAAGQTGAGAGCEQAAAANTAPNEMIPNEVRPNEKRIRGVYRWLRACRSDRTGARTIRAGSWTSWPREIRR